MVQLDLQPEGPTVRTGGADVAEILGHTTEGHTYLRLAAGGATALACVSGHLVRDAAVEAGTHVYVVGAWRSISSETVLDRPPKV
jgi:hypothetical protein